MKTCYIDPTTRVIADLIPVSDIFSNTRGYVITRINVPQQLRGQGLGSKVLREILYDADRAPTMLYLDILPSGPLDYDALESWYTRYGFRRRYDSFTNDLGYNYKRLPGAPYPQPQYPTPIPVQYSPAHQFIHPPIPPHLDLQIRNHSKDE